MAANMGAYGTGSGPMSCHLDCSAFPHLVSNEYLASHPAFFTGFPTAGPTRILLKSLKPTCHGLSQSSGIGNAPSHAPVKLEIVVIWRLFSQIDVTPFLLKTLSHALRFGPNKQRQGTVVKVDKTTANKNVSSTNSISGAPYRTKMMWRRKQDIRKKTQHFKARVTLCDNELLLEDTFGFTTKYDKRLTVVTEAEQIHSQVKWASNTEKLSTKKDGMKMLRKIENTHKRLVYRSLLMSVSFMMFSWVAI